MKAIRSLAPSPLGVATVGTTRTGPGSTVRQSTAALLAGFRLRPLMIAMRPQYAPDRVATTLTSGMV